MTDPIELKDGTGILRPTGSLTVKNVDAFRKEVNDWLAENEEAKNLILDLGEVDVVDSSGLGGILAIFKQTQERDGTLRIAAMSRKVRLLFEITRAHELFEIHDTVEAALEAGR